MATAPKPHRWATCSRELSQIMAATRHLVRPGSLYTVCGGSASHPEIWRANRTKPKCTHCLREAKTRDIADPEGATL